MRTLLVIHNMHGPTVFSGESWDDLPRLLEELARLNSPASNAGLYRLVIDYAPDPGMLDDYRFVRTERYEVVPLALVRVLRP